ncbi:hypothetical protein [Bacillus sp. 165]|uniref:hypothetical protein n=1 Tax=Bacillus sp. 165 TaxID=1529117 RepID=UPI001ADC1573|nr:hypothetical protein [Bacillus sp. 165]MBO9129188.1 hypothetical protein [Bacillus sp. 165]
MIIRRILSECYSSLIKLVLATIGILAVSVLPSGFSGLSFDIKKYVLSLYQLLSKIQFLDTLTYENMNIQRPIFPQVFVVYKEFLFIFCLAMALASISAFLLTYTMLFFKPSVKQRVKNLLLIIESLPDILIIMLFQLLVIWFFKKTGIMDYGI